MPVLLLMVDRCTVQHRKVRCLRACAENKTHMRTLAPVPMLKPSSRARLKLMPGSEQTDYVFFRNCNPRFCISACINDTQSCHEPYISQQSFWSVQCCGPQL